MLIVKTNKINIYDNLAKEEYLLNSQNQLPILFLWQSSPAIVIGKHQNPWKESLVDELKKLSIPIARRISGGGTVFHDLGNLNYTFICERKKYDSHDVYQMIFNALNTFNLKVDIEEQSNLCIDGKKFSGNAFTFRKDKAMHHGTLLVNSDLNSMKKYLKPQYQNINTKAISSRPASVINLNDLNSNITIETLSNAIQNSFIELFSTQKSLQNNQKDDLNRNNVIHWHDKEFDQTLIAQYSKKLSSNKWIFDKTPKWSLNS